MKTKGRIVFAGATDRGCVRQNNEDHFVVDEKLGLLIVADGMGGHNSGEVASELVGATMLEYARKFLGTGLPPAAEEAKAGLSPRARQLDYFVKSANTLIYEKGRALPKDAGMGTTVVAALLDAQSMTVAHVGDSRLYLWRQGQLAQLTEDHSLAGEQVRNGQITADEAARSSLQNILTRALGVDMNVMVDISEHALMPGDIVLMASDGLSKMLGDAEVAAVIASSREPRKIVGTLIEKSRAAGGLDNITVIAALIPAVGRGKSVRQLVSRLFKH
ncbi:MAG: Stp1/IreP family PP2C-type Ser/Thr phosphatase [Elusimicrobiota bacterium]